MLDLDSGLNYNRARFCNTVKVAKCYASVAELVDALVLGTSILRCGSSSLPTRTINTSPFFGKRCGGRSSVGRAPDCDSGGRGFKPHRPPQFILPVLDRKSVV